jgi:hypothetical protein
MLNFLSATPLQPGDLSGKYKCHRLDRDKTKERIFFIIDKCTRGTQATEADPKFIVSVSFRAVILTIMIILM